MDKLSSIKKVDNLYNNIHACLEHELKNEYNDSIVSNLIIDINNIKNKLTILLDSDLIREHFALRSKDIIKGYDTNVMFDIIETFNLYNLTIIEYYKRIEYLKSNCIHNMDYFIDYYNKLNDEVIKLREVDNNLVSENVKLVIELNSIKDKQTSHSITQSMKVEALGSELADVKTQRDFLKGLIHKNKETFKELENIRLENIKLKNEIDYYEYKIQHFLDEKYLINNNYTEIKKELEFYKKKTIKY